MPFFPKRPSKGENVRLSNCWNRPKPARQSEAGNGRRHGGETRKKGAGWRRVKQKRRFFGVLNAKNPPDFVSFVRGVQRPISSQAPFPVFHQVGEGSTTVRKSRWDSTEVPMDDPPVRDSLNCGESPQSRVNGL